MARTRKRSRISSKLASEVQVASDCRCCMCDNLGDHIHHIDGDHSNNMLSNLALLCVSCHERASRRSSMSRGLLPKTVARYRDEWHEVVARKKRARRSVAARAAQPAAFLEALQLHEIRKIGFRMGTPSDIGTAAALKELYPYSDMWDATPTVRAAVIDAIAGCSSHARMGMSKEQAHTIRMLASNAMLMGHLLGRRQQPFSKVEREVLTSGAGVGLNLAYDGALYLRDIAVVDSGGWVLWTALRLALVNRLRQVEATVREYFETSRTAARRARGGPFDDALRWLEWQEVDAGVFDDDALVPPPADVSARIDRKG